MSGCEACDALRKVAPRIMCHMTAKDDILCGYHASELRKENERLRDELEELIRIAESGEP